MNSRHQIGMAQGMLMERYGLDPSQSFALLRRASSTLNRKLHLVAGDLVEGRELPLLAAHDHGAETSSGTPQEVF